MDLSRTNLQNGTASRLLSYLLLGGSLHLLQYAADALLRLFKCHFSEHDEVLVTLTSFSTPQHV